MEGEQYRAIEQQRGLHTHRERFEQFNKDNPHVYAKLVALAREFIAKGNTRGSIRMLWEVLRWHFYTEVERLVTIDFKLNDHYVPYYARLMAMQEPDLKDFFSLRTLRTP